MEYRGYRIFYDGYNAVIMYANTIVANRKTQQAAMNYIDGILSAEKVPFVRCASCVD